MILRISQNKRENSFCDLNVICCFHEVFKGAHLKNNQSGINNDFCSRYVFHANLLGKHYDYYSEDNKKEFSSFRDKPERIVSGLIKVYLHRKIFCRFFIFIYYKISDSY